MSIVKTIVSPIALATLIVGASATQAEIRNDIPSCYKSVNLEIPEADQGRELIVVLDGTFDPDVNLKKSVHGKVQRYIKPNDRVSVVSFSSYIGDAYTQLRFSGKLEPIIPKRERSAISKKVLRQIDGCMANQMAFARRSIDEAIKSGFKPAGTEVPKSEIIANLSRVLDSLLQPDSEQSKLKTVLLVSDMLENSDITSFYRSGGVKAINVDAEIEKVKTGGHYTTWHGARVYVVGAGWVHQKYRKGFRGSNVMVSLEMFWRNYFELSGADLIAFGQPILMRELD